jgi:hypothetical protein
MDVEFQKALAVGVPMVLIPFLLGLGWMLYGLRLKRKVTLLRLSVEIMVIVAAGEIVMLCLAILLLG